MKERINYPTRANSVIQTRQQQEQTSRTIQQPSPIRSSQQIFQFVSNEMYSGEQLRKYIYIKNKIKENARIDYIGIDNLLKNVSKSEMDVILSWSYQYINQVDWSDHNLFKLLRSPNQYAPPYYSLVTSIDIRHENDTTHVYVIVMTDSGLNFKIELGGGGTSKRINEDIDNKHGYELSTYTPSKGLKGKHVLDTFEKMKGIRLNLENAYNCESFADEFCSEIGTEKKSRESQLSDDFFM